LLSQVYLWKKDHDGADAEMERVIALDPNRADGLAGLGDILNWAGRPQETVGLLEKAMRLNPRYPAWYLWALGHAYFLTAKYEEAISALTENLNLNPSFHPAHVYLAASYDELGQEDKAQSQAAEFVGSSPMLSLDAWKARLPYKDPGPLDRLFLILRKLGCK
jgi:tetratricopeptide (TPR) repeat protein